MLSLLNFNEEIVSRIEETIKEARTELRSHVRKISKNNESFNAVFTDGSFVLSDRRGAGISVFSSVSLLYAYSNNPTVLKKSEIDPAKTLLLLLPKFSLRARASTIMRFLEYYTALILAEEEPKYLIFDGSYLTSLLLPYSNVFSTFYEIISALSTSKEMDQFISIIEMIERYLKDMLPNFFENFSFSIFRDEYYSYISEVYSLVTDFKKDLMIAMQNFAILFFEQNIAMYLLSKVLNFCKQRKILPIWLSKDSESRILSKERKLSGFSNDLTLLDFVLNRGEYLIVSDILELPPVAMDKVSTSDLEDLRRGKRTYIISKQIAEKIYPEFGAYEVVYVKYSDYTIQLTYPKTLVKDVSEIISDLAKLSRLGYPEPLIVVHHLSTIKENVIKIISDSLYEKCNKNSILCQLLSDSGRRKIGL